MQIGNSATHRVELMTPGINGEFWISIVGGGVQRRAADGRLLATFHFGTDLSEVGGMVQQLTVRPDGTVWVAAGDGLWVWQGERFRAVIDDARHEVYALAFVSPHEFWVGRSGALERYGWDGQQARLLERIGHEQGLPSTEIRGLALGGTDTVWVITSVVCSLTSAVSRRCIASVNATACQIVSSRCVRRPLVPMARCWR